MATDTPHSLIERLRSQPGDTAAGKQFDRLYRPWMQGWLYRLAQLRPDHADAEDIIQDVFRILLEKLPAFQHNGQTGAFRNWIKQILVHCLRNAQRRRRALTGDLPLLQELEDPTGDLGRLWEQEHNQYLCQRLLDLARQHFTPYAYEIFQRVVLGEEPAEQVARSLQISVNAVLLSKSRVLCWLRRQSHLLLE